MDADRESACCFTGHREILAGDVDGIREHLKREIEWLYTENGITVFYAGGATGFDYEKEKVMRSEFLHAAQEKSR